MPHAVLFCFEIAQIVGIGYHFDRYVFYNLQSIGFKSYTFHGIVCKQPHFVNAQVAKHLCTAAVVALVGFETKMNVGIHRVRDHSS